MKHYYRVSFSDPYFDKEVWVFGERNNVNEIIAIKKALILNGKANFDIKQLDIGIDINKDFCVYYRKTQRCIITGSIVPVSVEATVFFGPNGSLRISTSDKEFQLDFSASDVLTLMKAWASESTSYSTCVTIPGIERTTQHVPNRH